MTEFAKCGCTHRIDEVTGVTHSVRKCEGHQKLGIEPRFLDRCYYSRLGVMCIEQGILVQHVQEMETALEPFADGHGKKCLEIGGGVSHYAKHLIELGYEYTGVDPSPFAAEWMRSTYAVDVMAATFQDVETSEKFDLILCAHALEHMSDPVAILSKMRTMLAPGGQVFILVPEGTDLGNPDHLSFFTQESLATCARHARLTVHKIIVAHVVDHERFIYMKASCHGFPRAVAGMSGEALTSDAELNKLLELLPPQGTMLEIGSASGVTAAQIAKARPDSRIVCVDTFDDDDSGRAVDWMANRQPNMSLWIGTASQFMAIAPTFRADLVFVDGDHSFEGCSSDLRAAVLAGGMIAAHDYGDQNHVPVKEAVDLFLGCDGSVHHEIVDSLIVIKAPPVNCT